MFEGTVLSSRTEVIDVSSASDSDDPELNPQAGTGEEAPPALMEFTVYEVRVEQIFRATSVLGDVVEVKVNHAEYRLATDQVYLLFLHLYDGVPASPLNPEQGTYLVPEPGRYESVNDANTVEITAELLAALA